MKTMINDAYAEEVPSELREHIKQEKLQPSAELFAHSAFAVGRSLLLPFSLIALVVIISRLDILNPAALLAVSFPILLAAQRCFQTLVHDLSHKLISKDTKKNDLLGNYLAAGWSGASVPAYRAVHMLHHKYNGSIKDPEHISFTQIQKRGGLLKHCLRYVFGLEALRLIKKYYGTEAEQRTSAPRRAKPSKLHVIICQALLAAIFILVAEAWYLYLLWLYLAVTWNPLLSNLRFLVEHPGESDLTVSTPSNLLERTFFAPYGFNFHLEHHLWPNLPPYRLFRAHDYLKQEGYFERHPEFLGSSFTASLLGRGRND